MAHARVERQPQRRIVVAVQVDGRSHQAPLLQHLLRAGMAASGRIGRGRCGQRQHALAALHQQLAQGFHVLAHFRLFTAFGHVVGEQGHGCQRRVQFMRHRGGMGGQGDDALVAGEAFAQGREFQFALAQRQRQAGGEGQHDRRGNQEIGDHAPAVEVLRAEIAVRQGLAEDAAGGVAEQAGQCHRQRPAQGQGERGQCDQDQEQRAERIGHATAPADHPGQDDHVHQDVAECSQRCGVGRFRAQLGIDVEQGQHRHAGPQRQLRQRQPQHPGGDQDGGGLAAYCKPAQAAQGSEKRGVGTGHSRSSYAFARDRACDNRPQPCRRLNASHPECRAGR